MDAAVRNKALGVLVMFALGKCCFFRRSRHLVTPGADLTHGWRGCFALRTARGSVQQLLTIVTYVLRCSPIVREELRVAGGPFSLCISVARFLTVS